MNKNWIVWDVIGWLFGLAVFAIGIINMFWGNDFGFGVFLLLLSFLYFPPVNVLIKKRFGFTVHYLVKIFLGIFILWAALGVGELFDKIDLMLIDFSG
ncbi:MAG: hypothetical protein K0B37_13940 [Bacteroidales bacterium]|nr:hypothetical protein [Bacteroidales bacterium]